MRTHLMLCLKLALATALLSSPAAGGTVVVDPAGHGDYDNIPEAALHAGAEDTVLVVPGTYTVAAAHGWPISLHGSSPTFVSQGGAAITTLEGDGTLAAFSIAEANHDARMFVHGFTFRSLEQTVDRSNLSFPGGPVHFTDNIVEGTSSWLTALRAGGGPDGLIARNVFAGPGFTAIGMDTEFEGTVEDNEISGYSRSGIAGAGAGVMIRRNHLHDNAAEWGAVSSTTLLVAHDNTVEGNGGAGFVAYRTLHLERNVIRYNGVGITWSGPIPAPAGYANMNDIYGNEINMAAPVIWYGPREFDASGNWWGTTDPEEISASIQDCNDPSGGLCCIIYDLWCTAPIPACDPTSGEPTSWGAVKALHR